MTKSYLLPTAALLVTLLSSAVFAQTQPPIPFRLQQNYITGLSSPIMLTHAGDGTQRKFIVEKAGIIKVFQPGSTTPTIFMNIAGRVRSASSEQGLLGLTFHPNFATNGYFFVNYTRETDGATVVSRFSATNNNTLGDANSERIVITVAQPFTNHNGGMIDFGADGFLYIGMGDGGSSNDPQNRSQNVNELLGKFLRINPDVSGNNTNPPYTNPPDNPYIGITGRDEIYAIGVRNPWRWSFDRENGELWAGDVGQGAWEEVSKITLGGNFGWRVYEGNACTGLDPSLCVPSNFTMPVFQYANAGARCSITGGYVYRGSRNALPRGSYVYGDFCSGEIFLWHNGVQNLLVDTNRNIASFGEDESGELYVVSLGGTIDRIMGNKAPADFDGDGRTDLSVFRPSNGRWYIIRSSDQGYREFHWGVAGDIPAPKDYDGDGKTDIAVFRPSEGFWYIINSSDNTIRTQWWGQDGDVPVAGDYDGDGKADIAIYRPNEGMWYIIRSTDLALIMFNWGEPGDIPALGDYDGDGRYDMTVWRPSTGHWWTISTRDYAITSLWFGEAGDIPTPGDFDGDGKTDQAVFRPSTGDWYVRRTSDNGIFSVLWGVDGDIPVVGDYDGDERDDVAVFRPSDGVWYIIGSAGQPVPARAWGVNGDLPIPAYDAR